MATKTTKKPAKTVKAKTETKAPAPIVGKKAKSRKIAKIVMWTVIVIFVLFVLYVVAKIGVNRAIDKSSFCGDAISPELCDCVRGAAKSELGLISKIKLVTGNTNLSDAEVNKLADNITNCIMTKFESAQSE